jgi:hypothetical protein
MKAGWRDGVHEILATYPWICTELRKGGRVGDDLQTANRHPAARISVQVVGDHLLDDHVVVHDERP